MRSISSIIRTLLGGILGLGRRSNEAAEFAVVGKRSIVAEGSRFARDSAGFARGWVAARRFRVELDLTSQVLSVEASTFDSEDDLIDPRGPVEAPLSPRLSKSKPGQMVSASVLGQKAKIFDDGLLAAAEVAAQDGAGGHPGKAGLLGSLGRALVGADPAVAGEVQATLLGAARLGQVPIPSLPPAIESLTQRRIQEFLTAVGEPGKPLGFYTWSKRLAGIFQQDRMLQEKLEDPAAIEVLAGVLRADPSARAVYETHLHLISRLTNPCDAPDLRGLLRARDRGALDPPEEHTRFFPPSVSQEASLLRKLYPGRQPIPDGFVLIEAMIQRIRSGELDLQPRNESGWYDHQSWALEPLVIPERMPEGPCVTLDDEYRGLLLELFKGLLALTRESHVKQLAVVFTGEFQPWKAGSVIIPIAPKLAAEPLPTFYLRRALAYRFVRGVLEETFGATEVGRMHRLTPDGPVRASLVEDLAQIEDLFIGAHALVSRQLGLAPDARAGDLPITNAAARRFAAWANRLDEDADLDQDSRAMVPIFYDLGRRKMKVWAFLGWASREITVSFSQPPKVMILEPNGEPARESPAVYWEALRARIAYPVTAELYVNRLLDRDEFRSLCDSCGTRTEILRRLEGMDGAIPEPPAHH